jgi:hypothetical protein
MMYFTNVMLPPNALHCYCCMHTLTPRPTHPTETAALSTCTGHVEFTKLKMDNEKSVQYKPAGPHHSPVNQTFSVVVNCNHTSRSSHSLLLDSSHAFVLAATHFLQNPSSPHGISITPCRPININGSAIRCTCNPVDSFIHCLHLHDM